jgi:regulator of sirC expression with transglutaminase-like and TPR domain
VGIFLDGNTARYSCEVSQASQISHGIVVRNLKRLLARVLANCLQTVKAIHILQRVVVVHNDATLCNFQVS